MDLEIHNNEEKRRFETTLDGSTAFMDYRIINNRFIITHTETPPELEGRGLGSALVRKGVEYARDHQLKVVTRCWFAKAYLDRHPEYQDLLA